jgi:hypothetical protein
MQWGEAFVVLGSQDVNARVEVIQSRQVAHKVPRLLDGREGASPQVKLFASPGSVRCLPSQLPRLY